MNLERELNRLSSKQKKLNKKAEELIPAILQDFNLYIRSIINLTLPPGYSLLEAKEAVYSGGFFTVYTGAIKTPITKTPITKNPLEIEPRVLNLLRMYEEKHNIIVRAGFKLGQ